MVVVMTAPRRKEAPARNARPLIQGLSSRPVWQGHLKLSLVSCAVGLYKATTTASEVSFNLINPKTSNRIKMVTTDPDTGPVDRSTLVKGYAVEKNNYVLFTEEELESVKLKTTRTLDIERFVDADTIDRLYWDTPYVLIPTDEGWVEAYGVIQQAMAPPIALPLAASPCTHASGLWRSNRAMADCWRRRCACAMKSSTLRLPWARSRKPNRTNR